MSLYYLRRLDLYIVSNFIRKKSRIKKSLLGQYSGVAGDLVFVRRNGKGHFRSRPEPRDPSKPKSEKTIKNETAFAYTSSFVKKISQSNLLKHIWKCSKMHGENYYGRIFSANRKCTLQLGLTLNNIISPEGVWMKTNSITWDDNYYSLGYIIGRLTENSFQPPFYAVSVIFLHESHNPKNKNNFAFLSFEDIVNEHYSDKPNIITFNFSDSDKSKISEFKKGIIYLAFISHDLDKKSVEWTTTAALEIYITL